MKEEAHHEKYVKLLVSNLNALVRSTGFSLKTQSRLVTSCILSRLDCCNCLLVGTPNSVIQPLQKIFSPTENLPLLTVFPPQQISIPSFCYSQFVCVSVIVCFHVMPYVNCFGRTVLYVCIKYFILC